MSEKLSMRIDRAWREPDYAGQLTDILICNIDTIRAALQAAEAGGVTEAARAARADASEVLRDVSASLAASVQAKITEAEIQCAKHAPMGGINYLCWFGRLAGLRDALAYIAVAKSKGGAAAVLVEGFSSANRAASMKPFYREDDIVLIVERDFALAAAIRALPLPSATKAGEWRPIETAAKNGEPVLIACDRTGSIRWAVWSGGMWRDGQVVAGGRASGVPNPTHWQPLPLPPTPKEPGL